MTRYRTRCLFGIVGLSGLLFIVLHRDDEAQGLRDVILDLLIPARESAAAEVKAAEACTQEQRLARIDSYCQDREQHGDTSILTDLSSKKHIDTFASLYAVPEKKLLLCMPYKSGSTTWQTLLAKNFMSQEQIAARAPFVAGKDFLVYHKVSSTKTAGQVLESYQDYYKVLVTRHPLDKLESVDNALLNSAALFQEVKRTIHKLYHPELDVPFPYPPGTFNITDLIRYMRANFTLYARRHYTPSYYDCLPCQIRYDYVVKLETMATDQPFVVEKKMNGVGLDLALNVQRSNKSALAESGKELKVFRTVSQELLGFAVDYYKHDMGLYGYQFNPSTRVATCRNRYDDGEVCC